MKVGMILPTYKDDNGKWKEVFLERMIPSLSNLRGLPIKFLVNFQRYSLDEIYQITEAMRSAFGEKFEIASCTSPSGYGAPPPMLQIREDTAHLDPTCDFYICADDDMKFNEGTAGRYGQVLEYMEMNRRCGFVMAMGHLGGYRFGEDILETNEMIWWTNRGLFLRRLLEVSWLFAPWDALYCLGTLEETYAVYSRLELGYYGAKSFNFPVVHRATSVNSKDAFNKVASKKRRYDPEVDLHNPKFDCLLKHIQQRWDDPRWIYSNKSLPRGLAAIISNNRPAVE